MNSVPARYTIGRFGVTSSGPSEKAVLGDYGSRDFDGTRQWARVRGGVARERKLGPFAENDKRRSTEQGLKFDRGAMDGKDRPAVSGSRSSIALRVRTKR